MSDQPIYDLSPLIEELDFSTLIADLTAEKDTHYEDPGADNYDPKQEEQVRTLMELAAFYDEEGPRSDPTGDYLCGSCQLREGDHGCLFVQGVISFTTGSCNIYINGDPLSETFELKEKFTPQETGYAERPEAKGFGCKRCSYGAEAKEADDDGRVSWCTSWGVHVQPTGCCMRHTGPDLVLISSKEE